MGSPSMGGSKRRLSSRRLGGALREQRARLYSVDTWPEENERDEFSPALDYCELVKPSWKKNGKIQPYGATNGNLRNPMAT
ncbi:hypothetical protein JHK82_050782 [Glycine max]|uniref:Uncharacterized protein n=1 Tax=Glycine soja TaxID=3848 RepID=A0A445FU98_GLYSO|nr:hypothetical protein JHK87_050463 [Glycine soja]KAG5092004.1 hypothetical protein JHK82_050782 [Glycine max]RZB52495.1 hypothetical protein D0Y65_048811 [Glycine soja]